MPQETESAKEWADWDDRRADRIAEVAGRHAQEPALEKPPSEPKKSEEN